MIVGKRALPALGLAGEGGALARRWSCSAEPDDIAIAFGRRAREVAAALALARERGCLTIAFAPGGAEWEFAPPADDPSVRQELVETLYHLLWELVHVFFEHRGLLEGREARRVHDTGASSFLYPFLAEAEHDLDAVLEDVRALGAGEGRGDRRAARADADARTARRSRRPPPRCGCARRAAASCSRSATAARRPTRWTWWPTSAAPPAGWPPRPRARPHRGPGDPHGDRQRHRHRGDLRAPDHRLRPRRATCCWRCPRAATRAT